MVETTRSTVESSTDTAIRRCAWLDKPTRDAIFAELYILAQELEQEGRSPEYVIKLRTRARAIRWLDKHC